MPVTVRRGEIILTGKIEVDLGIGPVGHLEIEDNTAAAHAEVEDTRRRAVGLLQARSA